MGITLFLTIVAIARAGGVYYDTGACQLILEGKIKVRQGEIASFTEDKIKFKDGSDEAFDAVVFATGFTGYNDSVASLLGAEHAGNLTPVGGFDDDGEIAGIARDCGIPNVYFSIGALMNARWFGKIIALQIIAQREGLLGERCEWGVNALMHSHYRKAEGAGEKAEGVGEISRHSPSEEEIPDASHSISHTNSVHLLPAHDHPLHSHTGTEGKVELRPGNVERLHTTHRARLSQMERRNEPCPAHRQRPEGQLDTELARPVHDNIRGSLLPLLTNGHEMVDVELVLVLEALHLLTASPGNSALAASSSSSPGPSLAKILNILVESYSPSPPTPPHVISPSTPSPAPPSSRSLST